MSIWRPEDGSSRKPSEGCLVKHLIIADGHYCGDPDEAPRFAALLEKAVALGAREVSILGDLFELWLGLEGMEDANQAPVLKALWDLKEQGVRLRYVIGNKDFFLEEWNARHGLFDEVCAKRWERDGLVLQHGDLVNARDRPYRLWRWFVRARGTAALAKLLPRSFLARLAAALSRRLRHTNRYHKSYFPEAMLRAAAARERQGTTLVFGHFHQHRAFAHQGVAVVTLPFLGGENAGVLFDRERWQVLAMGTGVRIRPEAAAGCARSPDRT